MTSLIPHTNPFPDLLRFFDSLPLASFGDHHTARIEEYTDNGKYVVRAELPGMDPDKDIHVTADGRDLTITAERSQEEHDGRHSEFFYGSFSRTVRLPGGADTGKAKAEYHAGVLEVTVPVKEDKKEARRIRVSGSAEG